MLAIFMMYSILVSCWPHEIYIANSKETKCYLCMQKGFLAIASNFCDV